MKRTALFKLTSAELDALEQAIPNLPQAGLRVRALAVRMLHFGHPVEATAQALAVAPADVRHWRRTWRKGGITALLEQATNGHQGNLLDRLTMLQKVSIDLMTADTFDDLCRQAVEMGLNQLGFDRLALFFVTDHPDRYIPSFGTDETGHLRDERRDQPIQWDDTSDVQRAVARQQDLIIHFDCNLYNHLNAPVGRGWNVRAALRDGNRIIGFLAADNLIHQQPLTDADIQILRLYGLTLGCLCSVRRAADALLKERNMMRGIMDSTLDMIYVKDVHSRVIMTNNNAVANLLPPKGDQAMIGLTDFDYLPQHLAQRYYSEEQHLIRTGIPILNREEPGVDNVGRPVTYLTTKVPLRDAQGVIVGLVGVSRDISDLKRTEEQNLRLMLEHERIELMQQLVSNLSHDLKTPLAVIKTSLYLLDQIDDPIRQKQKLQSIKEQAERLEKLIHDVLTVSRLDQSFHVTHERVDTSTLVQNVAANLRPRAEAKSQQFDLQIAPSLPPVMGSTEDLWRMVANLVENAINYTPAGGHICVGVKMQASGIVISVQDSGIGITPEQQEHIFERFYRADTARSIQQGGTGLGLSIVKMIVEQHKGKIKVESTPQRGSHFQVWLPADDGLES